MYGVWDNAYDIDWDSLPDKFIIKLNNGSGDAIICRNKSTFDFADVSEKLSCSLKKRFGIDGAEPHYLNITPRIIAEQLLDAEKQNVKSSSLVDYKIWCINGQPECVWVVTNRTKHSMEVMTYDLQWCAHPEYSSPSEHYTLMSYEIPRPVKFDYMLKMAAELSEGHPQVRVDLYEVDGKVYFGEMTFTSACGLMEYFTQDFLLKLGEKVNL